MEGEGGKEGGRERVGGRWCTKHRVTINLETFTKT